jgi:phage I-like protein
MFSKLDIKNIYDRYATSLNIKNELQMKKELIDLLQLEGVTETSTDEEVIKVVKEKFEQLQKHSNEENEANVNALISNAQRDGKVPVNMIETYREIGKKSGISALSNVLSSIPVPANILSMIKTETKPMDFQKDKSQWTLEDYRKYDPKAFESNPKLFDELYKKEFQNS